jgi:hypothetical protein
MPYRILLRRDLSANWAYNDPVLMLGEPGVESDTGRLKIGDGQSQWTALSYIEGVTGPVGPQGPAGQTGATGATGPKGDKGDIGSPGLGYSNGTSINQMMYWNGNSWVTLSPPQDQGQVLTFCNGSLTWTIGGVCPASLPTLSTTTVSLISSTTASSGGNINNDGGSTITARGVCWSTSSTPTLANNYTSDGSATGSYSSTLTNLTGNTRYYYRAYATNTIGTAYGSIYSFITASAGLSSLTTKSISKQNQINARYHRRNIAEAY